MKRLIVSIMMVVALLASGIAVAPSLMTGVAHADGGGGSE